MGHGDIRDWTALHFVILGGAVSLVLLAVVVVLLLGRRYSRDVEGWIETPCEIVHAAAAVSHGPHRSPTRRYLAVVTYRYVVDGTTHEAEGFGVPRAVDPSWERHRVMALLEDGGADGSEDVCFVDPEAPERSEFRIVPSEHVSGTLRIAFASLAFFALVAAYGVVRGVRHGFDR